MRVIDPLERLEKRVHSLEIQLAAFLTREEFLLNGSLCEHSWVYYNDTGGRRDVCSKCGVVSNMVTIGGRS